jgi:O-antigen/teichoic acid export membrane protein
VLSVEGAAARPVTRPPRRRLSGVVAWLTAANVFSAATGFVTGPLLARALGPAGRGELQAVLVPLSLAPIVFSFGISGFAYRMLPRGRTVEETLGSLGLPLLVLGSIVAAAAVPIADVLASGRETVRTFLIIGFLAAPLSFLILLLSSSLAALERWRSVVAMSVTPFVVSLVATIVLFAAGLLSVATASATAIVASLLAAVPGLALLRGIRRPVFRFSLAWDGIKFGVKSWLGGLAQTANARLDQLIMITVVPERQLGLYAVATTISGASANVTGAISPPLMTRIASGERHLMPQAVRVTVMLTIMLNLALALITPTVLSVVFGPQFRGAVPMALLLLTASVPLAGATVLSTALQGDGAPMIPSVAEGIALIVTVAGLLVLLKPLEGIGAAIVSVAAYSASFSFQVVMAGRRIDVPRSEFLVPRRADVMWLRDRIAGLLPRLGPRRG